MLKLVFVLAFGVIVGMSAERSGAEPIEIGSDCYHLGPDLVTEGFYLGCVGADGGTLIERVVALSGDGEAIGAREISLNELLLSSSSIRTLSDPTQPFIGMDGQAFLYEHFGSRVSRYQMNFPPTNSWSDPVGRILGFSINWSRRSLVELIELDGRAEFQISGPALPREVSSGEAIIQEGDWRWRGTIVTHGSDAIVVSLTVDAEREGTRIYYSRGQGEPGYKLLPASIGIPVQFEVSPSGLMAMVLQRRPVFTASGATARPGDFCVVVLPIDQFFDPALPFSTGLDCLLAHRSPISVRGFQDDAFLIISLDNYLFRVGAAEVESVDLRGSWRASEGESLITTFHPVSHDIAFVHLGRNGRLLSFETAPVSALTWQRMRADD